MGMIIGGSVLILTLIVLWQLLLPIALVSTGAIYGVKTVLASTARSTVIEAVTAPLDKPKRTYNKRIVPVINHYQLGKVKI